jgi:hypothetical protein
MKKEYKRVEEKCHKASETARLRIRKCHWKGHFWKESCN